MNKAQKEKLNELVTNYQLTKDETFYERAFAMCGNLLSGAVRQYAFNWTSVPYMEYESEANIAFHTVVMGYKREHGNFENILRVALRNKLTDLVRHEMRGIETVTSSVINEDNEDIDLFEAEIFDGLSKDASKEAQESVLRATRTDIISSLLVGASDVVKETVSVFCETNSIRETGRRLGVEASTIKRRLNSLAKGYDSSRFGDIADYLGGADVYATK